MKNKHLSYFKIENFKKFDSFEMDNISQFNLIVGENNVGKTTLLESLTFNKNIYDYLYNIACILNWRKYESIETNKDFNFFKLIFNNQNKNTIKYSYKLMISPEKNESIEFKIKGINELNEDEILILNRKTIANNKNKFVISSSEKSEDYISYIHDFINQIDHNYINFIPHFNDTNDDLTDFFSKNYQNSKTQRATLIKSLKMFINDLENIEISSSIVPDSNILIFFRENLDQPSPINQFGEGSVRFFRIIMEILLCKNNRLMIDEIDSGVHYSKLKNYFKAILEYSLENDTQVFATTHSKECIQYFQEALKELDIKDKGRIFSLSENKEKHIKSYCFTYDEFEDAIRLENEIR